MKFPDLIARRQRKLFEHSHWKDMKSTLNNVKIRMHSAATADHLRLWFMFPFKF